MQGKGYVDVQKLKDEYERISDLSPEEATKDSPLKPAEFKGEGTPQSYYNLSADLMPPNAITEARVMEVINALDS